MKKKLKMPLSDGLVYSTDPEYVRNKLAEEDAYTEDTLPPAQQQLRIWLERQKGGKVVTIVKGYSGTEDSLEQLGRDLKSQCGTGGSVKGGEILIQGDKRQQVLKILNDQGYGVKLAGG
ncbi:MAG: translation initiation factor [Sphingobacteriia bacterium]|nr:translation initiation factor [Sphingobacteriia bacterium]